MHSFIVIMALLDIFSIHSIHLPQSCGENALFLFSWNAF